MLQMHLIMPSWRAYQGVEEGVGVPKPVSIQAWKPLILPVVLTLIQGGLDSSEDSDSSDEEEDEEEEKEEEDLTSIYPQEDSDSGRDSDAYKPRSL